MESKKNLVLLGQMAAGKSTIGTLISKKLGLKFYDTDKMIENETNMSITEIFEKRNENFFRFLEEKIVLKILKNKNIIISLGGGAFLNDKIRKEIITNHVSFWLDCDDRILLERIRKNKKRPVANKLTNKELIELFFNRKKIYTKAKFKINCEKFTKKEVVKKVIDLYEKI